MAKMKKAMLLTLGMLLLSSLVFSLSILIFHNTQGTEDRFAELSLYDRLYDLDSSIQRGFKEIFTRNSGITLTIVDDLVTITETLPHSSNFESEMYAYEDYLEQTYNSDPKVAVIDSVLEDIKDNLELQLMPHNIWISHPGYPSGDELRITPSILNVENYSIELSITNPSISLLGFDSSGLDTNPPDFPLRVSVTTSAGTSEDTYNIDPEGSNTLTLNFNTGSIIITMNYPADLTVDRNSIGIDAQVEVELEHQAEEMNYIKYPDGLFTINIPGDNLQKTSTARIA